MSESSVVATPPAVALDECRVIVNDAMSSLDSEQVGLSELTSRVLASDVRIDFDFPPFASSAMDGWAIAGAGDDATGSFRVVGESRAGTAYRGGLGTGDAVVISTGAMLPSGAAGVVPLEDALPGADDDELAVAVVPPPGAHVRPGGRYARAGDVVCSAGMRLRPAVISALAASGANRVECRVRPRIAVITGGDELAVPGTVRADDQIYDANSAMLAALCAASGAVVEPEFYSSDGYSDIRDLVEGLLERCDALICCGGMSVGPHDHLRAVFSDLGAIARVEGVSMRPGRKFWFGTVDGRGRRDVPVFGLPGNPGSAFACWQLIVRHALDKMLGCPPRARAWAQLAVAVEPHERLTRVLTGRVTGRYALRVFEPVFSGSDDAIGLIRADAVALVCPGAVAKAGDLVEIELLDG